MSIPFSLSIMIGAIFFFVMFLLFSLPNYKSRFNIHYNLRNMFPYELNYKGKFSDNVGGNICIILSTICLIVFFSTFNKHYDNGFYIATLITGVFTAVSSLLLVFIPFELLKFHMLLDVVIFVFTLSCNGAVASGGYINYYFDPNILYLISAIIASVFTLIVFLLIMNPRLSHWADLSPEKNTDGTVSYKRPKYFVLAYSEWILIFLTYLTMVPIYLVIYTF